MNGFYLPAGIHYINIRIGPLDTYSTGCSS